LFCFISASLSISIASVSANDIDLSPIPSVGLSVVLSVSGKCTVAKRLIGSDAVWGGEWGRSRDGCLRCGDDRQREGAVLGVNFGCPIVTNGYFVS